MAMSPWDKIKVLQDTVTELKAENKKLKEFLHDKVANTPYMPPEIQKEAYKLAGKHFTPTNTSHQRKLTNGLI